MTFINKIPVFSLIYFTTLILFCKSQNNVISDGLNKFAIDILSTTTNEAGDALNIALSPYTIWTLMTVVSEGARGNTAKELQAVLNLPSNDKNELRNSFKTFSSNLLQSTEGVNLILSNAIFTTSEQSLNPFFQQVSKKYYDVDVRSMNFKNKNAAEIINSYIAKATMDRIKNFVNSDDLNDAQIFMTSALYFNGQWKLPFNKTATFKDTFYDEKQNKKGNVQMMYQVGFFPYSRIEHLKSVAIELPYGNGDKTSMIVILPFKDETIANVLNLMQQTPFRKLVDILENAEQEYVDEDIQVFLPKFSVESDLNLNVVLHKMGISDVFNAQEADLLGMFPHYLYISRLIQKAEIEVNEEGTVASSAAGGTFAYKSPPPKFRANKPFLYFIIDKPSKSIIFAGKISNPNALRV